MVIFPDFFYDFHSLSALHGRQHNEVGIPLYKVQICVQIADIRVNHRPSAVFSQNFAAFSSPSMSVGFSPYITTRTISHLPFLIFL